MIDVATLKLLLKIFIKGYPKIFDRGNWFNDVTITSDFKFVYPAESDFSSKDKRFCFAKVEGQFIINQPMSTRF